MQSLAKLVPAPSHRTGGTASLPSGICEVCTRAGKWILEFDLSHGAQFPLGTWGECIQRTTCANCRIMTCREVWNSRVLNIKDDYVLSVVYLQAEQQIKEKHRYALQLKSSEGYVCATLTLYPFLDLKSQYMANVTPGTRSEDLPEFCLLLDSKTINTNVLSHWLRSCDTDHAGSCHGDSLPDFDKFEPAKWMRLMDLEDNCIVRKNGTQQYVALSYVWGQRPRPFALVKENRDELGKRGTLGNLIKDKILPATITDAMYLAKELGCRYLWVDRLCITQDDAAEKQEQLGWMHSIYANAYITIFAMDGQEAETGLSRVKQRSGISNSPWSQKVLTFGYNVFFQMGYPKEQPDLLPWHSRGWTFQEKYLSKRCLLFLHDTVAWYCSKAVHWECSDNAFEHSLISPPNEQRPWPYLGQYRVLVSRYSGLDLSHASDAEAAFSAILAALSRSFPGGFIFGLPAFYFDYGMGWQPSGDLSNFRRRLEFPSWSWLGWVGTDVGLDVFYAELSAYKSAGCVYPMVEWTIRDTKTGESETIANQFHQYADMAHQPDQELPAGWTFEQVKPGVEPRVYRHVSNPKIAFKHPLPVAQAPLHQPVNRSWSQQLRFSTSVGLFIVTNTKHWPHSYDFNRKNARELRTTTGEWAGILVPHHQVVDNSSCELIVISRCTESKSNRSVSTVELTVIPDLQHIPAYEYYVVLAVERSKGIAYRAGVGRVWKPVWDRQGFVQQDVILG